MGTMFVLIVMFKLASVGGATSAEFGTKAACEAAAAEIKASFGDSYFDNIKAFCLQKN